MYYGFWFGEYEHNEGVHGRHRSFAAAAIKALKKLKHYDDGNLWFIFEEERPYVITIMKYTLEKNEGEWGVGDVLEYWELPVELNEHQKEWMKKYGEKAKP